MVHETSRYNLSQYVFASSTEKDSGRICLNAIQHTVISKSRAYLYVLRHLWGIIR